MSEHAPGPWTIEPREVTALLLSKDGTHLANIFANDNSILQPQSKWANARLIAAAPEMADEITALRAENEKLRAALKETASDFEMSLQIDKQKDAEIERLRAALAKAADDLDDWGGYVAAQNARAALEGK